MRLHRTLASGWEFAPDRSGPAQLQGNNPEPPASDWRPITVPGYWQVQFQDLSRATGAGWYRLDLDLEPSWLEHDSIVLQFGAVGHYCQGWLNGRYLGDHEGAHLPFSWSIDESAKVGTNELLVRVVSPTGDRSRFPDFPFEETLHGKQSWYGPAGGIWQNVDLVARHNCSIDHIDVRPNPETGTVQIGVDLATNEAARLHIDVLGPDGAIVGQAEAANDNLPITVPLTGHQTQWWSPEIPCLYHVAIQVTVGEQVVDEAQKRFGFRIISSENGGFLFNGEPFIMRGVLDQNYYESPGVSSCKQELIDRFLAVKAMGFNTVRCHIKIPDPAYLDAADEVGMLLWCELPTTSRLSARARERIENTLSAMVSRDRHHPSIVVWSVANEAWGYDLVGNAEHRSWLNDLYLKTKKQVPDRLIVDNSPCRPNFHIETDIEDYHFYAVIPEMRERWDNFLERFVNRADFTFSPHGDAQRTGTEPLVVSEFGGWGLPDLSDMEDNEPWWFESGQEWADGAAYVHGARQRFELWHLDQVFGSWNALCLETQRRQFETMQYQIETMQSKPQIAGYVLTELSDVHWEANGLLDMAGNPRSFAGKLNNLNSAPSVIAQTERATIWDGDSFEVELTLISGNTANPSLELDCHIQSSNSEPISIPARMQPGESKQLPRVELVGQCGDVPALVEVNCTLSDETSQLSTNTKSVLVVPRLDGAQDDGRVIVVQDQSLAERLTAMGYEVASQCDGASLRVMTHLSTDDHDFIEAGGRGLLLIDNIDALGGGFGEFPPIELKRWRDALFGGGEWVSAFSWLDRGSWFKDLPGGPLMDAMFEGLAPDVVITGIPPARFEYDVLAGVFVGWVHQVGALIARHNAGLGSLTMSTLKLTEHPLGSDPLASWLLHQLIRRSREM